MRGDRRSLLDLEACARGRWIQLGETLAERIVTQCLRVRRVFWIALATQHLIDVDVLLQRQCRIQDGLNALHAMLLDRLLDLASMVGRMLDDVLADLALT